MMPRLEPASIIATLVGFTALSFTPLFHGWEWWQIILFGLGFGLMARHA